MKKIMFSLAPGLFAILMLLAVQGCKKNNAPGVTNETVTVNLSANEIYNYTLPASGNGEPYAIESSASGNAAYSISNDASGSLFVYTPVQNFSGSDQVVISNEPVELHPDKSKCHHTGCGHAKKGQCNGSAKQSHKITFNITVAKISE